MGEIVNFKPVYVVKFPSKKQVYPNTDERRAYMRDYMRRRRERLGTSRQGSASGMGAGEAAAPDQSPGGGTAESS